MTSLLWNGEEVDVNESNARDVLKLGNDLCNQALMAMVYDYQFSSEDISVSNAISRLNMKSVLEQSIDTEIAFIASNLS